MVDVPLRRVASVGRGDHACHQDVALGQARHHLRRRLLPCSNQPHRRCRRCSISKSCRRHQQLWVTPIAVPRSMSSSFPGMLGKSRLMRTSPSLSSRSLVGTGQPSRRMRFGSTFVPGLIALAGVRPHRPVAVVSTSLLLTGTTPVVPTGSSSMCLTARSPRRTRCSWRQSLLLGCQSCH
jgi:hypothetical protein